MPTIDNNVLLYVARVITAVGNHKVGGVVSGERCQADGTSSWNLLVQEQAIVFINLIYRRTTTNTVVSK